MLLSCAMLLPPWGLLGCAHPLNCHMLVYLSECSIRYVAPCASHTVLRFWRLHRWMLTQAMAGAQRCAARTR